MADFVKVCKKGDLPAGSGRTVDVKGKPVALFNVDGNFHAIDNTCLHRGGPLAEGELNGGVVTCPWHGWQYEVTSGECRTNPAAKLRTFEVKVEAGEIFVAA